MDETLKIWESLHKNGYYEGITLSEEVRQSWARSRSFGVDPYKPRCDVVLSSAELQERKKNNKALLEQATVMMKYLDQFMRDTNFVFFLEDSENYIISTLGEEKALEVAGYSNLVEGANWSEQVMGTNSGSLALVLKKPIRLCRYENFCRVTTFSHSSSAPIFNDEGDVIGVFGIASPYYMEDRYNLGIAVAASKAIERQMALHKSYQNSEMANLHKTAIMESMSEGVLTLDREFRVTHLNLVAARNLGIDYNHSVGRTIMELLYPGNDFFIDRITGKKRLSGEPVIIKQKNGTVKVAISSTPLSDNNGKVLGTVIILQPMKQYKKLIERVSGAHATITFADIIGQCAEFKHALMSAEIASKSNSNVLLQGESGVGKDMFAQAIHNASSRSREPFFAINCAALPRELISSELFGYEEGAFTGARKGGNPGKFELADQGTIFLDEIGEMPLDLQGSLLRLLEEGTVVRLGGREVIPVNVRIIAASNKNLLEEVKKGNFRLDLYYRLEVINIKIPPLRERVEDIPELVHHFIKTISPRLGKEITGISDRALEMLANYEWPGNIRELNNVIERAINIATGSVLDVDHITIPHQNSGVSSRKGLKISKDALEEQLIRNCLQKNNNNKTKAAEELGISRMTLYRKMAKYCIE